MKRLCVSPHVIVNDSGQRSIRGGTSLIQLLVVLTFMSAITTIAVRLISALLRVERQAFSHVTQLSNLGRLSRRFRADVHAAKECEPSPDSKSEAVKLTLWNGHVVVYDSTIRGVTRVENNSDGPIHQELYRVPGMNLVCEKPSGPAPLVTLIVRQAASDQAPVLKNQTPVTSRVNEFRIDARLGHDFSAISPGGK